MVLRDTPVPQRRVGPPLPKRSEPRGHDAAPGQQVELDAIGHLHKLRTESEFEKLRDLWRCVASLQAAYFGLPNQGFVLAFADESLNKKLRIQASFDFSKRLSETFEIWSRELLSIPEDIAKTAEEIIKSGRHEEILAIQFPDPYDNTAMAAFDGNSRREFWEQRNQRLEQFKTKVKELLARDCILVWFQLGNLQRVPRLQIAFPRLHD